MENENPFLSERTIQQFDLDLVNGKLQTVSSETIFQLIRNIKDPEHPYTLEQLSIVSIEDITVGHLDSATAICRCNIPLPYVKVTFTPTIPHCSMAGIIGLTIFYQLKNHLDKYLIFVEIKKDTHSTYQSLNKQLSDKDRVMAAFENEGMVDIIHSCIGMDED